MITRAYALYQGCTYLLYCCWYIYTYVLLHACILHANLLTSCQYMLMYTMFWFFVTYSIGDLRVGWLLLMSIFLKKILLVWFRGHFVDFLFYLIDPPNTITKKIALNEDYLAIVEILKHMYLYSCTTTRSKKGNCTKTKFFGVFQICTNHGIKAWL